MKNYSEMSDHQINVMVAKALDGHAEDKFPAQRRLQVFDPCNSWADAGPIIQDNAIGIMPFKKEPSEAWSLAAGLLSNTTVKHKNPLRAAMIAFLMMNEAANANS